MMTNSKIKAKGILFTMINQDFFIGYYLKMVKIESGYLTILNIVLFISKQNNYFTDFNILSLKISYADNICLLFSVLYYTV